MRNHSMYIQKKNFFSIRALHRGIYVRSALDSGRAFRSQAPT